MKNKQDSPGVYIPPPLFYALLFVMAIFLQKKIAIDHTFFESFFVKIIGVMFLILAFYVTVTSMVKFFRSKNTIILIKPANSLQTTGIYSKTRNPMYLGLVFIYLGLTCQIGNWWHVIFFPLLLLIIQGYVISKEEKYLERAFGQDYLDYKSKVRRWV